MAPFPHPIPVFGHAGNGSHGGLAAPAATPEEARHLVHHLVDGGAAVIKIGLEPGGEPGAPWTTGHEPSTPPPWPMLSLDIVKAIVEEAHSLDTRVAAHVGEKEGVALSLAGGLTNGCTYPAVQSRTSCSDKP